MFRRVLLDHWMAIFPLTAFITASVVYTTVVWKTWRMRPPTAERFAHLPFNDESASRHDA